MTDDKRWQLLEDVIEGIAHGEVAESVDTFSIRRVGEDPVIEVEMEGHDSLYLVTVSRVTRPR